MGFIRVQLIGFPSTLVEVGFIYLESVRNQWTLSEKTIIAIETTGSSVRDGAYETTKRWET